MSRCGLGGFVYGSAPPGGTAVSPAQNAARNQRYTYLMGRLHARQITMEEATELFTIMQSMIQTSEAARAALVRAVPAPPIPGPTPVRPVAAPAAPSGGDDLLLVGILAMGAGAGLLAAMTKRIQDATPPASTTSNTRPDPVASTRKG